MTSLILTNARIRTVDDDRPLASTLVITDGVVTSLDDEADIPAGLPVYDLGGRTVVPGFVDAHTHPTLVAQSSWHVRLPWTNDVDEILRFVAEHARAHPPEEAPFLYFEYYPSAAFSGRAPTKELLDSAVSDRPVLCQDFSDHAHWVNSRMLELMGVTKDTPDPVPGLAVFVRDEHGEPTGHVRESAHAFFLDTLFAALGWSPPTRPTPELLAPTLRFFTEHGVTALFEARVNDEEVIASVAELDRRGELNLFYDAAVQFRDGADLPEMLQLVRSLDERYGSRNIRVNTLKLFLDGTNESGSGSIIQAHDHDHGDAGLGAVGLTTEELADCLLLANAQDVGVHIHVVGDLGFRTACDAVELAQGRAGRAWSILVTLAHCELIDPADLLRPAALGIAINWTTHWSGGYFGDEARALLGPERWNRMYRFGEIADSGALLAFSSDVVTAYELDRANPLFGMQVAHTRVDPQYPLDPDEHPGSVRPDASSRLPLDRLLRGWTTDAAAQLGKDGLFGSLAPGRLANLSVLSDDPFEVAADRLSSIRFDAVLFEGRVVSGSLPDPSPERPSRGN